jgi:hypothetical protein
MRLTVGVNVIKLSFVIVSDDDPKKLECFSSQENISRLCQMRASKTGNFYVQMP